MPKGWIFVISAVAGFLILVFGGAAIYLNKYAVDMSGLRPQIEQEIFTAIGRETKITGPIRLGMSLIPFVKVQGITVANEPWGKSKHFITIKKMNVITRLIPLLRGTVEIVSIDVEGAVLHLEVDGRVKKNWNLVFKETGKENNSDALIEKMFFKNLTVNFRDIRDAKPKFSTHIDQATIDV